MTITSFAADDAPTTLYADPKRWVFRVPLTILSWAITGSILVICARVLAGSGRDLSLAARASSRIAPLCTLAYAYIRFVYVARTRLAIDAEGVSLQQPSLSWTVSWPELSDISEAGPLNPTNRAGIGAAAILHLRSGGKRSIPDIFAISRNELTACLVQNKCLQDKNPVRHVNS